MLKSTATVLAYLFVRLLASSYRFRFAMPHTRAPAGCDGYILAIWHQNLFAGILAQAGRPHVVIISRSRDGDPVAYLCKRLGHRVSRGSSRKGTVDKGGKEAKDEMIEALRGGLSGAVTVDGPSGPAFQVKPGIIEMARRSGLPIVPYLAIARRYWSFRSWDAFRLPKPFTRIQVIYGAPLHVPTDTPFEDFGRYQDAIAAALLRLEHAGG